jgi:hypothetical protein
MNYAEYAASPKIVEFETFGGERRKFNCSDFNITITGDAFTGAVLVVDKSTQKPVGHWNMASIKKFKMYADI